VRFFSPSFCSYGLQMPSRAAILSARKNYKEGWSTALTAQAKNFIRLLSQQLRELILKHPIKRSLKV